MSKTNKEILNLKMPENDAGAETIGEFLRDVLVKLWIDGPYNFDAKCLWDNDYWWKPLANVLCGNGLIEDCIKLDGGNYDYDFSEVKKKIVSVIKETPIDELVEPKFHRYLLVFTIGNIPHEFTIDFETDCVNRKAINELRGICAVSECKSLSAVKFTGCHKLGYGTLEQLNG